LGRQFATLGAKQQAKNAQSWHQVFSALTPSLNSSFKVGLRDMVSPLFSRETRVAYAIGPRL